MRTITLEKVIDKMGPHLIAAKKVSLFNQGDIIKINTPDGIYHVICSSSLNENSVCTCTGCLFEATRLKYGMSSCPTFKNDNLLCVHTHDEDIIFMPLASVLENL